MDGVLLSVIKSGSSQKAAHGMMVNTPTHPNPCRTVKNFHCYFLSPLVSHSTYSTVNVCVCGRLVSHLSSVATVQTQSPSGPNQPFPTRDMLSVFLASHFRFVSVIVLTPLSHYHLCFFFRFSICCPFSHYIPIATAFISRSASPSLPLSCSFHLSSQQLLAISVTHSIY